jgi:para-nitrobenzyl esterase
MPRKYILSWMFIGLLLCGCSGISGRVTMDGVGIMGAPVVLKSENVITTQTDKDGHFEFKQVKAGPCTVTLEPLPGWTRPVQKTVLKVNNFAGGIGVDFSITSATNRQTTTGKVVGISEQNGCHAWLGIPYAMAPTGDLRWKAPKPGETWNGTWLALEVGPVCTQFASLLSNVPKEQFGQPMGSEDCLYLNIWAPAFVQDSIPKGADRLPVMLCVHGGGNTIGNGGNYNGKELAKRYNVIVVSCNYRLGPFGWFSHPALHSEGTTAEDRSGNYGTLDIIRSMAWVRENISGFGGDPDNVTILGESAGALNILTLLLSPQARGLFHKAIIESGGIKTCTMAEAENYFDDTEPGDAFSSREVVNKLLIADGKAPDREAAKSMQNIMSSADIAAYLLSKNNYEILRIYKPGYVGMISMPKVFNDGVVLPQGNHIELLKDPASYNAVPIIIGTNRDEQKPFMILDPEYVDMLFGLPVHVKNRKLYELTAGYMSDRWKAIGADEIASAISEGRPGSIWVYRFDWDEEPKTLGIDVAFMLGAAHSLEIPFVFCDFTRSISPLFKPFIFNDDNAPARIALSNSMSSYWVQFAYKGAPGKGIYGVNPEWPAWDKMTDGYKFMVFDTLEGGGIRMSEDIITMQSLKARLLAETEFPSQKDHCAMYVKLFEGTDLWNEEEYLHLGKCGCSGFSKIK